MSTFTFRVLEMTDSSPQEWLATWAGRYDSQSKDDIEHADLIKKHRSFSAQDFEQIGQWKDDARAQGRWQPNVASVAYKIWMQAAAELPKCPRDSEVAAFLENWSERRYTDKYANGTTRSKCLGLSRATTLLHFLSGARYPIFDSRVRTAFIRLLGERQPEGTPKSYLESYVPLIRELAEKCGTTDLRMVDKALFAYASVDKSLFAHKALARIRTGSDIV